MKLIYFLIILIAIYLIATQIKVTHVNSLPNPQKRELKERFRFRKLLDNYVKTEPEVDFDADVNGSSGNDLNDFSPNESKMESESKPNLLQPKPRATFQDNRMIGYTDKYSSEQFQSTNYKHNFYDFSGGNIELPNANNLYILIKSEYVDDQYRFNVSGQPVTTRYPSKSLDHLDRKYIKHIRRDIEAWNELFYKYYQTNKQHIQVRGIKPIFVMETLNEFIIKVNVSLLYLGRSMHFQLLYYGQIERTDDFLDGSVDKYILQLVEIKPITKSEFDTQTMPNESPSPFMSMNEQMEYVDRINQMHKDEENYGL